MKESQKKDRAAVRSMRKGQLPWLKISVIALGMVLFTKVMLAIGIGAMPQIIIVSIVCYAIWQRKKGEQQREQEQS